MFCPASRRLRGNEDSPKVDRSQAVCCAWRYVTRKTDRSDQWLKRHLKRLSGFVTCPLSNVRLKERTLPIDIPTVSSPLTVGLHGGQHSVRYFSIQEV